MEFSTVRIELAILAGGQVGAVFLIFENNAFLGGNGDGLQDFPGKVSRSGFLPSDQSGRKLLGLEFLHCLGKRLMLLSKFLLRFSVSFRVYVHFDLAAK